MNSTLWIAAGLLAVAAFIAVGRFTLEPVTGRPRPAAGSGGG